MSLRNNSRVKDEFFDHVKLKLQSYLGTLLPTGDGSAYN